MIVLIDNYDSFTYNLVQYFGELGQELVVYRNDEVTIQEIEALAPSYLVISPGPALRMRRELASRQSERSQVVSRF